MGTSLYLMRHTHPVNGHPMDATRKLDDLGHKQAKQMADFLVGDIGRVDIVISSPFTRAMETAEVMADALGSYVASTRMLEPDQEPEDSWAEIERLAQQSEHVLVVGHDPSINKLLGWLISGGAIRFDHGAIAHLKTKTMDRDTHDQVIAKLHWLVDPKLVGKEEAQQEVVEAARAFCSTLSA